MLISELEFGSFLTYCPRTDNNEEIKKAYNVMLALKQDKSIGNKLMSEEVSERIAKNPTLFKDFFGKNVALVPVPGSSLMKADTLWVSDRIAKALANQGLGVHHPCLTRIKAVKKSAYSNPEDRPKAIDHYNGIQCDSRLPHPSEILLIDDVITRGATLLGCANVLRKHFPQAKIKGFAVIRTISNPADFSSINSPCTGLITLEGQDAFKRP